MTIVSFMAFKNYWLIGPAGGDKNQPFGLRSSSSHAVLKLTLQKKKMKYLNKLTATFIGLVLLYGFYLVIGQTRHYPQKIEGINNFSVQQAIIESFSAGNPQLLLKHMKPEVCLNIDGDYYELKSRTAIDILDDFLTSNPAVNVLIRHTGGSDAKFGSYVILEYETKYLVKYRCFFYIEHDLIAEINIDLEKGLTDYNVVNNETVENK